MIIFIAIAFWIISVVMLLGLGINEAYQAVLIPSIIILVSFTKGLLDE